MKMEGYVLPVATGKLKRDSKARVKEGGRPGQVVMEGDSCSKGCEFESQHHILDGHFFTLIYFVKFAMC